MMLVFGSSRTLINSNAATADSYAAMKRITVHAVGRIWERRRMLEKDTLIKAIDKRMKELRDIDDPSWAYPYILQRIDELRWVKNCVEKMDSSTTLCQTQLAGEDEVGNDD